MGAKYNFNCPKCGYSTQASGGDDCGLIAATTTVACEDCQELYDVVIARRPINMNTTTPTAFKPCKFQCPKGAKHRIKKWVAGGLCPKCATTMETGRRTLLWD
jgi:hypothetical protein